MKASRKTKGSEEQTSQAPAEADFVGLVKYISERERKLDNYSDKLRISLQRIFDTFGDSEYCQICNGSEYQEFNQQHIKFRDNEGYLHREPSATINGITVQYPKNPDYSHEFLPKIPLSIAQVDVEAFAKTEIDHVNFQAYVLCAHDGKLLVKGIRNAEIDETGVTCWYTTPAACRNTLTRRELKLLVRSGRLPKFLHLVGQKVANAEVEYGEVSTIAEKMAKAVE